MIALLLAVAAVDPLGVATAARGDCASTDSTEIVVCGSRKRDRRYRLPQIEDQPEGRAIRAETRLAPASVRASTSIRSSCPEA